MARTFIRQDIQIRKSGTYADTTYPSQTAYETNPTNIEDDLNSLRSAANHLATVGSGHWYTPIPTPGTFENGAARGVHTLNQDLHDLERKRLLDRIAMVGVNISGGAGQHVVLIAGQLPNNTTLAIGNVSSLGTVVATASPFNAASVSAVVTGANALQPKNLLKLVDSNSGDPILDASGREVFGLLQCESTINGSTCSDTGPNRLQISYVVRNATSDALILATAGVLSGKLFDYGYVLRSALQDMPEEAWLGDGFVDSGVANVTRQAGYDNQGTAAVGLTNNAALDLKGAGIYWEIRDNLAATLLRVTEGSGAGTTTLTLAADLDQFTVNAAANSFAQGVRLATVTQELDLGITPGTINSVGSADLRLLGAGELYLDDGNQAGSTWAQTSGIKLSDTTSEWDAFELAFGEVSILNAIVQAKNTGSARGVKTYAVVTTLVNADTDVGGISGGANLDAQLPSMSAGSFLTDYDVFLNGTLLRPGANSAANNDYYPGTSLADGQLRFEFQLRAGDVLCVIPYV